MRINCPHCGIRDHSEFTYGGDGTLRRPDDNNTDLTAWNDYTYQRQNPKGRHTELWHHIQGCRLWLSVVRDTVTHNIESAEIVGPWASHYKQEPLSVVRDTMAHEIESAESVDSLISHNKQEAEQ